MGKSAQVSYQWIMALGLSAPAVGIMQIRGLGLLVNEMIYLINGAPMSPPVMKIVLVCCAFMLIVKRSVISDKSIFFIEERSWLYHVSY
jgi:hypothetical protein